MANKLPIYLDYASTTPADAQVVAQMLMCMGQGDAFGNAASLHYYGVKAKEMIENARTQVADLINAQKKEIVFTSGATEAINLALKGAALYYQTRGNHIITAVTEHKAVLDSVLELEKLGFKITFLSVQKNGTIKIDDLINAITSKTILISLMYVNNEIGVIQDIPYIANLTRAKDILLHVDCVQAIGKLVIDVKTTPIDLLSVSAHKIYGPKGVGALYVRAKPKVRLQALLHGGGHEDGLRSGTLATQQIVGFGTACLILKKEMQAEIKKLENLRQKFCKLISEIPNIYFNTDLNNSAAHIVNISFKGINGEALLMAINRIAVSSGAACTMANLEPSYVLRALNVENELAKGSLRISFGRFTTDKEIEFAVKVIKTNVERLRALSLFYDINDYDFTKNRKIFLPANYVSDRSTLYNRKSLTQYLNLSNDNIGKFCNDKNIFTAYVGSYENGTMLQLQLKMDNDKIVAVKFKVYGCGFAIGTIAFFAQEIKNKTLVSAKLITPEEVENAIELPDGKKYLARLVAGLLKDF